MMAWGSNSSGQLGINSTISSSNHPVAVTAAGVLAGKTITAIAGGSDHSLALCADGTLAAWGLNDNGQLGNNSTATSLIPINITASGTLAGKRVIAIAAGFSHSLALCSDGSVVAWGEGSNGQLGNGATVSSNVPVAVDTSGILAGKTVTALAAGSVTSVALCADGAVAGWGGYLGYGWTNSSTVPIVAANAGVLAGRTVSSHWPSAT